MPALVQNNARSGNATTAMMICSSSPVAAAGLVSSKGIWSKHGDDVSLDQLQKFWSELPPNARQELMRIDKQTLFEQARKNMYCSRCNGLLLEGFTQIIMYGKSLQQEGAVSHLGYKTGSLTNGLDRDSDDMHDPSVHPWGGLVANRDGTLTLMDCYLYGRSLQALQNVFDSARAREHEREILHPDACGGGGRGWISHGMGYYGRVHGTRETCALHTARLSCDTLVDFWSALGNETRLSLLRMKEEDFIERLMYRFDSKRFCRDCRRNVIREFKELKELKRMRREIHCTSWFCVADTAFQYEVSEDMVQANWHQSFTDAVGMYHHFEWAIGTAEGKFDILDFEDVGMTGEVQANGLDLNDLDACFITLRAWRLDGRCTELSVKAHSLKGQPCVHNRLVVGDGFVTIMKGENIRRFFEHAEEAEEEEDDDAVDKDGNELDSDGSRPQRHAKTPELAREFLLDAATVIFKEQVEKAFREGTARQNAHSTFVCLALKLLEERVHVACKEIITLEKQMKLLEEEEKEKREEEERRERRRTKEREKKLRRKERLKEKEREKERKGDESGMFLSAVESSPSESTTDAQDEPPNVIDFGEEVEQIVAGPVCPGNVGKISSRISASPKIHALENDSLRQAGYIEGRFNERGDTDDSFVLEQPKSGRRNLRFKQESVFNQASKQSSKCPSKHNEESETKASGYFLSSSKCHNGVLRNVRGSIQRKLTRNCVIKNCEKYHPSHNRMRDGYEYHSCSCNHYGDHGEKDDHNNSISRPGWEIKTSNKALTTLDASRQLYNTNKYSHGYHATDGPAISKGKSGVVHSQLGRVVIQTKKVWEPTDLRKKCLKNGFFNDITPGTSVLLDPPESVGCDPANNEFEQPHSTKQTPDEHCSLDVPGEFTDVASINDYDMKISSNSHTVGNFKECPDDFGQGTMPCCCSKDVGEDEVDTCSIGATFPTNNSCDTLASSSSSDNCSSCLSEVDSNSSSSSAQNIESSSTSDSEDASQLLEGRDTSRCNGSTLHPAQDFGTNKKNKPDVVVPFMVRTATGFPVARCTGAGFTSNKATQNLHISDASQYGYETVSRQQQVPPVHNSSFHIPYFSAPTMAYHNQGQASWSAVHSNGLITFARPHQYIFPSPLGYGLPANQSSEFSMQYNSLQPMASAFLNVNQPSMHHPMIKVNIGKSDKQTNDSNVNGNSQENGTSDSTTTMNPERLSVPNRQCAPTPPLSGDSETIMNADKSYETTFSLFHSGGPVAPGYSLDPASLKNRTTSQVQTKSTCLEEETTVEEYSLFASNGGRFSFF